MALPLPTPRPSSVASALRYSDHFDYPLTLSELWFWQVGTQYSKWQIKKLMTKWSMTNDQYFFLPGRKKVVATRLRRARYSLSKRAIAKRVGESLQIIPTILAVFVTGALAMNNSPRYDDIDLMIVTSPNTLWITRILVILYLSLKSLRRPTSLPEHTSPRVSDTICDNLYLDSDHLVIHQHKLYTAHEILQAKPLFDRSGIHHQFLVQNSWVGDYLPIAYRQSLINTDISHSLDQLEIRSIRLISLLLWPLNLLAFLLQYAYMKPKMTSERVSLGYAFFHPHSSGSISS